MALDRSAKTPPTPQIAEAYAFINGQHDLFHRHFIIYDDRDSGGLHFFPSGWMGDLLNSKRPANITIVDDACTERPFSGLTCMKVNYPRELTKVPGRLGWIGVFSQYLDKNWGEEKGYDLSGYCFKDEPVWITFMARGEKGSERVKFQSGGINRPPYYNPKLKYQDTFGPIFAEHCKRDGIITLDSTWRENTINLTGQDLSNVIGAFCWAIDCDLNHQGATFFIDEIRLHFGVKGTQKRLNEPRFIRSYIPLKSGAPDCYFRNACFVYDNALALSALVARGTPDDLKRAQLIADAFVYAQDHDRYFQDGRLRNAYACGDLAVPEDGTARLPGFWSDSLKLWCEDRYYVGTDCGNMAWTIIALLNYWEKIGKPQDSKYLRTAMRLGDWIIKNTYAEEGFGGFKGGLDGWEKTETNPGQDTITWKSTEHNLDIYVAFSRLRSATADNRWNRYAEHAYRFVLSMWDSTKGHFWTGTLPPHEEAPERLNKEVKPLDVHPWAILALQDPKYTPGMTWAMEHCWNHPEGAAGGAGFDFKGDSDNPQAPSRGIWWEGTAQMGLAFKMLGEAAWADSCLENLRRNAFAAEPPGVILACYPDVLPTGFRKQWVKGGPIESWNYYRRAHLGATCWYLFAELGWNPYWGE